MRRRGKPKETATLATERYLGKGEVDSSILSGSTSFSAGLSVMRGVLARFICTVMLASPALAAETWQAIDGDTILLTTTVTRRLKATEKIRLVDVDAPELHARCQAEREMATAARDFVAAALAGAREIRVERVARRDKYGRTLAVVRLDGVSLSAMLLGAGLVRPYHGERRQPWC